MADIGSTAAMRKALEWLRDNGYRCTDGGLHFRDSEEVLSRIRTALSAPPRNCNVVSAMREALEEFVNHASCLQHCDIHRLYPETTSCDGVLADGTECPMKAECDAVFKGRAALSATADSGMVHGKTMSDTMKTAAGCELTEHEKSCIRSLKRLAKKWHKHTNRLWLFSANSHLAVLLGEGNGNMEPDFNQDGTVNQNNIVVGAENIDIPNDGGDW